MRVRLDSACKGLSLILVTLKTIVTVMLSTCFISGERLSALEKGEA